MKTKITYWTFTTLFLLPLTASGIGFTINAPFAIAALTHLGYPIYIIRFLGIAKLLGVTAVITGTFPRLKEWAYAGFVFNMSGAIYSHLCAGDGPKAIPPVMVLVFIAISYIYWKQLSAGSVTKTVAHGLAADEVGARVFVPGN